MTATCSICGRDDSEVFLRDEFQRRDGGSYPFELRRCRNCGLGYISPQPTDEFLIKELYTEEYSEYSLEWAEGNPGLIAKMYRTVFPRPMFSLLPTRPGKALDAGCGSGYWMSQLRARGWDVFGVDISETAVSRARSMGFPVTQTSLEAMDMWHEEFDLVVLSAVLEHVRDPRRALRNAFESLRPGGILLIDVPNFGSVESKMFMKSWSLYGIGHLFYYTQGSLGLLLRESGFHPEVFVRKSAEPNFVWSMRKRMPAAISRAIDPIAFPYECVLNALNQSGDLYCRASKSTS